MYTQCPECDVAFRVTAEILRQAAGKVRCGSCGGAFNALEYLSEDKPAPQPRPEPEPDLPELTPEAPVDDDIDIPESISAEQSAALLKTLDELAGEDIRIEDTGVEWRVVGPDDDDDDEAVTNADGGPVALADDAERPDDTEVRQMRFDDDTPLPDDFDLETEAVAPPEPPLREPAGEPDAAFSQVDLELGEPDDWEDLLGEFGDDGVESDGDEIVVEETPFAESRDSRPDTEQETRADAGEHGSDVFEADNPDDPEPSGPEPEGDDSDDDDFYSLGPEGHDLEDDDFYSLEPEDDLEDDRLDDERLDDERLDVEQPGDEEFVAAEPDAEDAFVDFPVEIPEDELEAEAVELADDLQRDESPTRIEAELAAQEQHDEHEAAAARPGESRRDADRPAQEHLDIPELTEEEKTINMLIDQDLLAIAVEDEDGFVSTIVQRQPDREHAGATGDVDADRSARGDRDVSPLFETIVMAEEDPEVGADEDSQDADDAAGTSPADRPAPAARRFGTAAGVFVLVLALAVQFVHYSRETLATVPAINDVIAPVYRAIGRPVSPGWDVSGWRFEATKGSTDETGERLSIYSRIGNTSNTALPLPVVHVALTDRFEEATGSRILEPAEYLVGDADPRQAVPPGQTFDAVITIENPSPEATGFQLNVCYRLASGRLRCAIEDFR